MFLRLKALLIFSFITVISLEAKFDTIDSFHPGTHDPKPWFTGTLLSPGGSVLPPGHFLLQPYLFVTETNGAYDSNWYSHSRPSFVTINTQFFTLIGLIERFDFQINPQWIWNSTRGAKSNHFADLPAGINFQVLKKDAYTWIPGIKLGIKGIFPTGKYNDLDPDKKGTDISGLGSYGTQGLLVFLKEFHTREEHYLTTKLSFIYTHFSNVHVKGFNAFGGGFRTHGTVSPGAIFAFLASFEYSFTRKWVFALDCEYDHKNRTRFKGHPGFSAPKVPAVVGGPSSELISFAPALEYNFDENLGVIGGVWFTAAGRNAPKFTSGVISLLYVH